MTRQVNRRRGHFTKAFSRLFHGDGEQLCRRAHAREAASEGNVHAL